MSIRTYSELMKLKTFEERFEYLKLSGKVGVESFGFDRYLNQAFYKDGLWRHRRDEIIIRDAACDLAIPEREIKKSVYVHHMNPIRIDDIENSTEFLLDPEYLICVSFITHQAIHYGDASLLPKDYVERSPNDTCPWKR